MGRYDRQLLEFTAGEQERIRAATVGIAGCGGLGSYAATALALAGIGRLILIDPDVPDITNLNRQFIYCEHVLSGGEPRHKSEMMAEWIRRINPEVNAEYHIGRFDAGTCGLFDGCDVMVDCLDSISSRLFLNEYSVRTGKPMVHGGISGFTAELCTIVPGTTACLRCILGDMPDAEKPPASIGSVVMFAGSLEATEVLKLVTGRDDESRGTFCSYDLSNGRITPVAFKRDPGCPVCGRRNEERAGRHLNHISLKDRGPAPYGIALQPCFTAPYRNDLRSRRPFDSESRSAILLI